MISTLRVCVVLLAVVSPFSGGTTVSFPSEASSEGRIQAAHREQDSAWFLDEESWLLEQRGENRPRRVIRLGGQEGSGTRAPTSLVRWKGRWLVTDGTAQMYRFSDRGAALSPIPLPTAGSILIPSGTRLWIYNELPSAAGPRFWTSADGERFIPLRSDPIVADGDYRVRILSTLLVLSGGLTGDVFYARLIGPPILRKIDATGALGQFPLAYVRSAARARLTRYVPGEDDLTRYSTPVRDMVAFRGAILTLRNREDERFQGGFQPYIRRRVDRYSLSGRHLGTANLPSSGRWILREERGGVSVMAEDGEIVWRPFGTAVPGAILP